MVGRSGVLNIFATYDTFNLWWVYWDTLHPKWRSICMCKPAMCSSDLKVVSKFIPLQKPQICIGSAHMAKAGCLFFTVNTYLLFYCCPYHKAKGELADGPG